MTVHRGCGGWAGQRLAGQVQELMAVVLVEWIWSCGAKESAGGGSQLTNFMGGLSSALFLHRQKEARQSCDSAQNLC